MARPPSTGTTAPVTYAADSEHRNAMTAAHSSAVPRRRSGTAASTCARQASVRSSVIAVTTGPGATSLQGVLRRASPPSQHRAGAGHARAEAGAQHEVAGAHAAIVDRIEESERDRRRRRVPEAVDVDKGALGLETESVRRGVDDASVRLVRHEPR